MGQRYTIKRRLLDLPAVKQATQRTRSLVLPGFGNFTVADVWRPFWDQLRNTSLLERAAAISFNVFMAIPPTLIFIFTLIPYLPISERFVQEMFSLIRDIVPGEENNSTIIGFLSDFLNRPRNGLLSFGLLVAIFFSSNAMMGVLRSFDKNYPGFGDPTGLQKRQTALKLTLLLFVIVFVSIFFLIAQAAFLKWLGIEITWLRNLIADVRWIIILLLVFYSVSVVYRFGPALQRRWPYVTPGSVFATTLMALATFAVSFWVNNFASYNKLYGSISAVFILMSLIYVNALVILIGFELNVTLSILRRNNQSAQKPMDERQAASTKKPQL